MKITDFRTNDAFTICGLRCRKIDASDMLSIEGRIELRGENFYRLITDRGNYDFSVSDMQDARYLADKMKQCPYNLACVSNQQRGQEIFFLHIVFFFRAERKPHFNIVLGKKVKQTLLDKQHVRVDTLEDDIQQNFLLSDGTNSCYAVTIGNYAPNPAEDGMAPAGDNSARKPYDENAPEDDSDSYLDFGRPEAERKTIVLYGRDYTFSVKFMGEEENSFFYAESVDTRRRQIPPMALFIGELTFRDGERFAAESIRRELELTRGYLDVWDRYTSIEGDFLLEKARKVGLFSFDRTNISYDSGGFKVYPKGLGDEQRKLLSEGDELLMSEDIPIYLTDRDMSWKDYRKRLSALSAVGKKEGETSTTLKLQRVERDGSWVLSTRDNHTFPSGMASLSLVGNMRQIMRREDARERIANGEAANPALGLLIEGKKPNTVLEVKRQLPINPLSAFVKEKLFKEREPRERQKEAIRIALNTPDIAIIQGPPGTGKTTVITAIVERLNELADKRQNNQGQVLLTSFQHDAVRNVIERLRINSLPTPKYGRQGTEDMNQEQAITQWRLDYAERLKERNPQIQQTAEQQELFQRHNAYLISPSESNALHFLEYAKRLNKDNALAAEIDRLSDEINVQTGDTENLLLARLRRIRITRRGFLDDGPAMADEALLSLEEKIDTKRPEYKKILDVLEEAADFTGDDIDEAFLKRLAAVRNELISRCTPKPVYNVSQPNPEILAVFDRLQPMLRRPQNELGEILYNLLNELENNTDATENIIRGYSFAYAATAQQSEGTDIRRAKNTKRQEHPEYDTVIIDEAARVNPGDLMIPMSQARRRIILVGDHRQLPHIYDEEIFDSMRDDGSEIGKNVVTKSMFEYIREKLDELEKIDHIPRTITLDAQYRMHPVLGDFVNRNFYEPHGEGFESPRGEEHFRQGLAPQPYLWVDLPHHLGDERKWGISRQRECEADCIVEKLKAYMDSPEGSGLSYGVITFYRAQKDIICDKLRLAGLLDRVRVGSVDAFQGMEFDVIFLSVVRTHGGDAKFAESFLRMDRPDPDENGGGYADWLTNKEKIGMHVYGRLVSENLLCVALSRQKKLLIVVGDAAIFHEGQWGALAEKCVPALRNFYELCDRGGMIIHGNA